MDCFNNVKQQKLCSQINIEKLIYILANTIILSVDGYILCTFAHPVCRNLLFPEGSKSWGPGGYSIPPDPSLRVCSP